MFVLTRAALYVGILVLAIVSAPSRCDGTESGWSSRFSEIHVRRNVVYGEANEPMHRGDIYVPKAYQKAKIAPTVVSTDSPLKKTVQVSPIDSDTTLKSEPSESSSSVAESGTPPRLPAVLVIHGGAWTLGDKSNDKLHAARLAEKGYWVFSINYRLAPKHPFPAQLEDCKRALQWVHDNADIEGIDRDRVGVWGYSAGGQLSALTSLDPPTGIPAVRACVCGGAPFDLTQLPAETIALRGVFGGTPAEVPHRYKEASPLFFVHEKAPPLFLFHGAKDWLVPEEMALAMKKTLESAKVDHELVIVPDKGHIATFVDRQIAERSFDFLDKYLKPDSTWRSVEDKSE